MEWADVVERSGWSGSEEGKDFPAEGRIEQWVGLCEEVPILLWLPVNLDDLVGDLGWSLFHFLEEGLALQFVPVETVPVGAHPIAEWPCHSCFPLGLEVYLTAILPHPREGYLSKGKDQRDDEFSLGQAKTVPNLQGFFGHFPSEIHADYGQFLWLIVLDGCGI